MTNLLCEISGKTAANIETPDSFWHVAVGDDAEARKEMQSIQLDMEDWLAARQEYISHYVNLRRVDLAMNMARFYRLGVERDLFGHVVLCSRMGRIGRGGRVLSMPYPMPTEAHAALERQRAVKERRGYARLTILIFHFYARAGSKSSQNLSKD